jgi:hypothetical protein
MGELVGLGVRGMGKSSINIDLVPASVVQERAEERRKPYLIASAAVLLLGFAAWGTLNHRASVKATELADEIEKKVTSIGQYEGPIRGLVTHEDQTREVVNGYVASERQRVFWIDVLVELKTRMAHDAVWVVDFEPLVDYNAQPADAAPSAPAAQDGAPAAAPKPSGTPVVAMNFGTTSYGLSSLALPLEVAAPPTESKPKPRRGGKSAGEAAKTGPMINAVRVRGLWRDNPDGSDVVYKLLAGLREGKNSMFKFDTLVKGKPEPLDNAQIIRQLQTSRKDGELAWTFEMVLPLAEPMPLQ